MARTVKETFLKVTLPEPSLAIVVKEILGRFLWHGVVLLGNIAAT
jgi:hypothetical protein